MARGGFLWWRLQAARDRYAADLERHVEPLRREHMPVQPELSQERVRRSAARRARTHRVARGRR